MRLSLLAQCGLPQSRLGSGQRLHIVHVARNAIRIEAPRAVELWARGLPTVAPFTLGH